MGSVVARSWFNVWNNPEWVITYKMTAEGEYVCDNEGNKIIESQVPRDGWYGLSEEEICQKVVDICCASSETRACACAFCVSAKGLRHLHFVCSDSEPFSFFQVKQLFPQAHIEETKGSKTQAENYIYKKGSFAEKGEQILCIKEKGEFRANQGHRSDLDEIERLINDGYKPNDITSRGIRFLSKEKLIRSAFFLKRANETPILREVKVYYHYGLSGSGKSYTYTILSDLFKDDVYFVGQYDNGFLDNYNGEKVLFMDEFRGQLRFATLLTICQGYKQYYHARNHDILGLWEEVHITSVIPPELLYKRALDGDSHDVIQQFLRRLTGVYYHFKTKEGKYDWKYIDIKHYDGFKSCFVDDDSEFVQLSFIDKSTLPF